MSLRFAPVVVVRLPGVVRRGDGRKDNASSRERDTSAAGRLIQTPMLSGERLRMWSATLTKAA